MTTADADVERARQALDDARAAYRAALLAEDPAEADAAKAEIVATEVALDRADAVHAALRERFLAACEHEAELERRASYAAAVAAADEARRRLAEYEPHARAIAGIVVDVAKAELAVREANKDLPDGAEQIPAVEFAVRGAPGVPAEVIGEKVTEAGWHYCADGPWPHALVEPDLQSECRPRSFGARIGTVERVGEARGRERLVVVKRRHRVMTVMPAAGRARISGLGYDVQLPGLRHLDPAFWVPTGAPAFYADDPAEHATAVVQRGAELEAAQGRKQPDCRLDRFPDERRELVDEPDLLAEAARYAAEIAERGS